MSLIDAIQTVLKKYAEFEGRAARSEFWWWMLFYALVTAALSVFNVVSINDVASMGTLLTSLLAVAALLPNLAVAVRRLRDSGYSWYTMFWGLVPVAGVVILIILWTQPTKALQPIMVEAPPAL